MSKKHDLVMQGGQYWEFDLHGKNEVIFGRIHADRIALETSSHSDDTISETVFLTKDDARRLIQQLQSFVDKGVFVEVTSAALQEGASRE